MIKVLLQGFQKAFDMPAVGSGVVTGQRKRHLCAACVGNELACLYGRKVVRLVFITVDREMREIDPRHTGHRIGVWRRSLRL